MTKRFSKDQNLRIGIVGATGMVGALIGDVLSERNFPISTIRLFASKRSAGKTLTIGEHQAVVEDVEFADYSGLDIVFFSAGGAISKRYAPLFAETGAIVIDNSSAWRGDKAAPLVVPEVNATALEDAPLNIIANPNCTTMAAMPVLKVLHDAWGLSRMIVSTYQAASGAGLTGIDELSGQLLAGAQSVEMLSALAYDGAAAALPAPSKWSVPLGFNVTPLNYVVTEDGYTDEELKLRDESRKILDIPSLRVSGTCVRVPVMTGHCLSISAEFERTPDVDEAHALLAAAPGVELSEVPNPLEATGMDEVFVGRLRRDAAFDNGLSMFVVGDNLRKGAALNAVQIAEALRG